MTSGAAGSRGGGAGSRFPPTQHSIVAALAAVDPEVRAPAFEALVASYWRPAYRYLMAARGLSHEDAEDLTQEFFARAFSKDTLASYDPAKARFRTFVRVCLDRVALNAFKANQRLKRGGGQRAVSLDSDGASEAIASSLPLPAVDPEAYFRREWIRSLFDGALADTTAECRARGKDIPLAIFLAYDIDPPADSGRPSYAELATRHGLPITQITNHLALVRKIFRRAVLDRLKAVTASAEEYAAEAREILGVEVG